MKLTNEMKTEILIDCGLEESAINCVLAINGDNETTYTDLLYYISGYNDFEQLPDEYIEQYKEV